MEVQIEKQKQEIENFNKKNQNVYYFYKKYLHN